MFQISKLGMKNMSEFNVTYRITQRAGKVLTEPVLDENDDPVMGKDGKSKLRVVKDDNKMPVIGAGDIMAEIIDLDTNEVYIQSRGDDPMTAVENALQLVPTTPKPKTVSQKKIDAQIAGATSDLTTAKDAEIAKLKRDLAKLQKLNQDRIDEEAAAASSSTTDESAESGSTDAPETAESASTPTPPPRGRGRSNTRPAQPTG
jgi:hypothetical protein